MSENNIENGDVAHANVLNDDPLGVTERKIARLNDDIANAEMFGDDTTGMKNELRPLEDMRDYLKSRDYKDNLGNIHDTNSGRFKAEKDANSRPEDLGQPYEEMPMDSLIAKWAEAEDNADRTTSINVQDELHRRLLNEPNMDEDLKMRMIDRMHESMMKLRKGSGTEVVSEDNRSEVPTETEAEIPEAAVTPEMVAPTPNETEVVPADTDDANKPAEGVSVPTTDEDIQNVEHNPLKVALNIDVSENVARAADFAANERIQQDKENADEKLKDSGRLRNMLSNAWQGMTRGHRFRTYRAQEEKRILENIDYIDKNAPAEARAQAKQALFDQFKSQYEEVIHTEAGEKREILADDHELSIGTKDLIRRYCAGEFSDDKSLEDARSRMLADYQKNHPNEAKEEFGNNIANVNDLVEIAKAAAGMNEHGESMDNILDNMQIILGEARSGARTETQNNFVEKIYEKLARSKIGSVASGAALISGISIAMSVGRYGGQSFANAATKVAGVSIVSAGVAALKKNREWKEDRTNHQIGMVEGRTFDAEKDPHRAKIAEFDYNLIDTKTATEVLKDITSEERLSSGDPDVIRSAVNALVAIETRIKFTDSKKKDLFSFSNPASMVQERFDLDIARANAKAVIDKYMPNEMREEVTDDGDNFQKSVDALANRELELVESEVSKQDSAFNKLKNKEVKNAAIKSALIGATIGIVLQEVGAIFDNTRAGLLEQAWGAHTVPVNGVEHSTMLGGLFAGNHPALHTAPNTDYIASHIGKGEISMSTDHSIVDNGNGTISLMDSHGHASLENIKINSDGSLPQDSINHIKAAGMSVTDKSFNTTTFVDHSSNGNEFVHNHMNEMTNVHRTDWYNNNTPGVYDKNELKLDWGGTNGNGITSTGYQFDVSHMTSDGSYHGGLSVNAAELIKQGKAHLFVSATEGTQSHAFQIDINPDGKINIPSGSAVSKLFAVENGHAVFKGAYAEVAQTVSGGPNVQNIIPLATEVGEKAKSIVDKIPVIDHHIAYQITGFNVAPDTFVEMSPVIPVESSEQMKPATAKYESSEVETPVGYGYYNEERELSEEEKKERERETSPRLLENPGADLVPGEEFGFYKGLLIEKKGQDYVSEIEKQIEQISELNSINNNTNAIITVPVNAAGKAESSNIYSILTKGYGGQDPESLKNSTILLHVNWMDSYDDPEQAKINIEKTKAEIERAKNDLGNRINIAVVETEFKRAEVQNGIIGHVARKMNDIALLALNKAVAEGRMDVDHDTLIIRNDADIIGMRKNYLSRYIEEFKENTAPDIYLGMTSFDQTNADRAPGLVFAGNFMQMASIIDKSREGRIHTAGGNFGVKASTLAAVGGIGFSDYTGAGSDDVEVGARIKMIRSGKVGVGNSQYAIDNDYDLDKKIGKNVYGARLDLDAGRGEKEYINDRSIAGQWNKFDVGGYSDRDVDGNFTESFKDNPNKILQRIEGNIEGAININKLAPSTIRSTLAFTFPSSSFYDLQLKSDGSYGFSLTNKGKKYLENNLSGKLSGKSYGVRKKEWYGANNKRSSMIKI